MADNRTAGGLDDEVRLEIDGVRVAYAESYEIKSGILSQPDAFSFVVGHGGIVRELLDLARPGRTFKLSINGHVQQIGRIDGATVGGKSATVTIRGRDELAKLHDSYVQAEKSIKDAKYTDLVRKALAEVGLEKIPLATSNLAARRIRTGRQTIEIRPPRTVEEILTEAAGKSATGPSGSTLSHVTINAKFGETWYSHVKRELDRAGLFLWHTPLGFVLSEPNSAQPPTYSIEVDSARSRGDVVVEDFSFRNEATHRHSAVLVYGKGGFGKFGTKKDKGDFVDDEMEFWGYRQPLTIRDPHCENRQQAEFLARRRLAEERRNGWELTYVVTGHSAPSPLGGRAVWTNDTVVNVNHVAIGIRGPHYIEACSYARSGNGTTTTLNLMRPTDLIFGSDQ